VISVVAAKKVAYQDVTPMSSVQGERAVTQFNLQARWRSGVIKTVITQFYLQTIGGSKPRRHFLFIWK